MADFYELLGISRDASPEQIKKAFRALARQYHPDVAMDDPDAESRFKEIARAYEVLSDPEKRARYDAYGEEGLGGNPFAGVGLSDLFDAFFGGAGFGGGFGARGPSGPARGPDAEVRIDLDLRDAMFGLSKTIEVRLPVECETCEASGCRPGTYPTTCETCGGAGEVRELRRSILGQIVSARACPACRGQGRIVANPCADCGGEGRVTRLKQLEVDVPAGIDNGQRLRLAGRGPAAVRGGLPGDLYVSVGVKPHPDFERVGDDLVRRVALPMTQAVLGARLHLDLLDTDEGKPEELVVPPGTQPATVFRLRGRGVPHLRGNGRGDVLLTIEVEIPDALGDDEDELVRRLAEIRGEEVAPRDRSLMGKLRAKVRGLE
ncbi:MAG TPA: J domain-containing protein [Acidimicrobiia bacterium]|nr:J domain-containing protein [Acidimicrobiia bacterium]